MGSKLHSIATRIGFTEIELKVILFVLFLFFFGYSFSFYDSYSTEDAKEYDYSMEDSLFLSKLSGNGTIATENNGYETEVLNLSEKQSHFTKKEIVSERNSIDINKADKKMLMQLPGVGEKTAEAIVIYRNKIGKFTLKDQLMDIKGIGPKKYEKIKEYIFINK